MRRATTPIHYFTFPIDPSNYPTLLLTYKQKTSNGVVEINKTRDDFTFERFVGSVRLTQEETLMFESTDVECGCGIDEPEPVEVQLRALDNEGLAYGTDIWRIPVRAILNSEVLG